MSSENSCASPICNIEKCSLVLVDVAGTTTSIDFVKDTLLPFVSKNAETFLKSQWDESSIKEILNKLQEGDDKLDLAAATELVKTLTEKNSDKAELKEIQGLIYKRGYEDEELKGHVYPDVGEAFESWASSHKIAIFSSGSIESQKLLFTHSESGDLSAYITNYFDLTTIGPKTEAESYKKIAKEVKVVIGEVVFISDDVEEVQAAKTAGMNVFLIQRGNSDADTADLTVIKSFKDLTFENTAIKRKIEEESPTLDQLPPSKIAKIDEVTVKEPNEKDETKKEENMEVGDEKSEETTKTADNKKETDESTTTKKPEKSDELKADVIEAEEKQNEMETDVVAKTVDEKDTKTEEEKKETEKKEEAVEKSEEPVATTAEVKPTVEKENKSVLANGVENGEKSDAITETSRTATSDLSAENGDKNADTQKGEETEVKVKKLEETTESKTVSVEV